MTVAYLINTTPKYFYLLPLHLTLLERYATSLLDKWSFTIATECPEDSVIGFCKQRFSWLQVIPLLASESGFLESRAAAVAALPANIQFVLPIQEDFLLERYPDIQALEEAVQILDTYPSVHSLRLMPCPGPALRDQIFGEGCWRILDPESDSYIFTYQATLWRRESYLTFMQDLLATIPSTLTPEQKVAVAVKQNIAEINTGQALLVKQGGLHLAWPRGGSQPNAVYMCPWPYRPTAVVRGMLEPWAEELAIREGAPLAPSHR